jgi:hypothetical protein
MRATRSRAALPGLAGGEVGRLRHLALRVFREGAGAARCRGIVTAESNTWQAKDTTLRFAPGGVG